MTIYEQKTHIKSIIGVWKEMLGEEIAPHSLPPKKDDEGEEGNYL
jgi:hypothetical protein